VIALPAYVFIQQLSECLLVKIAACQGRGIKQNFTRVIAQVFAKPAPDRYSEPVFFAVDDVWREHIGGDLLEKPFCRAAAQLEIGRDASGELDEVMVKKRGACFQGSGHA